MKFEYPLQWLSQQPRTKRPQRARFGNRNIFLAGRYLFEELRKLGAKDLIISSNLQQRTRGDGFYANQKIDDTGIAIYFKLKELDKAMACDKWDKPEHNLWALYLSISAIRGLERWGGSEFLDGLFTGFKALPAPGETVVMEKNYFIEVENLDELKRKYRELCKKLHPDVCGSSDEFNIMSRQFKQRENSYGE